MAEPLRRSGITFQWQPLPSVVAGEFNTLGANIKKFDKPLRQSVREVMSPSLRKNFEVGGRPSWQPLTDTTHKLKASRGHGGGILIATGRLASRAGAFDLWKIQGDIGLAAIRGLPSAIYYGIFHQTGWQPPAEGPFAGDLYVEARPWAVIQVEDANDIEEIFFEWIEERIEKDLKSGKVAGGV